MKRNNILMGAYITFIFICYLARVESEYESWDSVVSAVTISSALFAVADFLYIYAQSLSGICDIARDYIEDTRNKLDEEKKVFSEIRKRVEACSMREFDFSEMTIEIDSIMAANQKTETWLQEYTALTKKKERTSKRNSFFAVIFTFLGFLSFLCIVVFSSLASACSNIQDLISVFAFGVILSTQYIHTILTEKMQKDAEKRDQKKAFHNESRSRLTGIKEKVDAFFMMVENGD